MWAREGQVAWGSPSCVAGPELPRPPPPQDADLGAVGSSGGVQSGERGPDSTVGQRAQGRPLSWGL